MRDFHETVPLFSGGKFAYMTPKQMDVFFPPPSADTTLVHSDSTFNFTLRAQKLHQTKPSQLTNPGVCVLLGLV